MRGHESFPNSQPLVPGAEERYMHIPFGRSRRAHIHAPSPLPDIPVTPEQTTLDLHQEQVAAMVATFFNGIDKGVAQTIGYTGGNIREELRSRLPKSPYRHSLDTTGLDPVLGQYLHHDIFFFRVNDAEQGPASIYEINRQVGLSPIVEVGTTDGFIRLNLYTGRNNDSFSHIQARRVFNDDSVTHLTAFAPNYRDPYAPSHPLILERGWLPMPQSHMIYDDIDFAGNVTLLDGQFVRDPSGYVTGVYSATDHSITSVSSTPFPYVQVENGLVLGYGGEQVYFPIQTNLYTELENITGIADAIS